MMAEPQEKQNHNRSERFGARQENQNMQLARSSPSSLALMQVCIVLLFFSALYRLLPYNED